MTPLRPTAARRLAAWRRSGRPAARRLGGVVHIALVPVLLVACNSPAERINTTSNTAAAGDSVAPMSTSPAGATPFRVVIGDTTLTGHLFDTLPEISRLSCR